jgi:Domain of unknown function (DUF4157)
MRASPASRRPALAQTPGRALASAVPQGASCSCGGGCPRCGKKSLSLGIARHREASLEGTSHPLAQLGAATRADGAGRALPEALQRDWGGRLERDLSPIRVHDDAASAGAMAASGAGAASYGRHLFFAPGRYAPDQAAGRALLGHELTHALQTKGAPAAGAVPAVARDAQSEGEADRVGTALAEPGASRIPLAPAAQAPALRGDKQIRFSGTNITVSDTYVLYGDAATAAFLQRFQSALNTFYNSRVFNYRGYTVRFSLSVRQIRHGTRTRRDREGFEHTYQTDLDSSFDSGTELFEVKTGTGNAGGFFSLTLYEGDGEATIAHEVGHYLSDKTGYFSERYSEGLFSRIGSIFGSQSRTTTPDAGCEDDIMATLSGTVRDCSLSDFLDKAIDAQEAAPPELSPGD